MVRNLSFIGLKQVYFKVPSFAKTTGCFQVAKITNELGTNISGQLFSTQWQWADELRLCNQHNKEITNKTKGEKKTTNCKV